MYAKFIDQNMVEPLTFPHPIAQEQTKNGITFTISVNLNNESEITPEIANVLLAEGYKEVVGDNAPKDVIARSVFVNAPLQITRTWETVAVKHMTDAEKRGYTQMLRRRREKECFRIVDRNQIWKDSLTDAQRAELVTWYLAWLDAPETLTVPNRPSWLA